LLKQAQEEHDSQRKAMLKAMQEENLFLVSLFSQKFQAK